MSFLIRRRCSWNEVSSRSLVNYSCLHHFQLKKSSQTLGFVSSISNDDDDDDNEPFSELGPEVYECSTQQIKLVTEKQDPVLIRDRCRRVLTGRPVSSKVRPRVENIVSTLRKLGHSDVLTFVDNTEKISDIECLGCVSVKDITSEVSLSEILDAISEFGKVTGASFIPASNGHRSCKIHFEDAGSSRKAILAGKIVVGSQIFPVHPVGIGHIVMIRIKNINKETTYYAIHSRCKSAGEVVGLTRRSKDVVDAYFDVPNDTAHLGILRRLNATVINLNHWSAEVVTSNT